MIDLDKSQTERVYLTGLAVGGECVGEIIEENSPRKGKKIFVRNAIPGEVVIVRITRDEKNLSRGEIISIELPSESRTSPPCPYFNKCGGCDLQHMNLPAQRSLKLKMVESMLARQAGVIPRDGTSLVGGDLPGFGYRNRVNLHLNRTGQIGFYKAGSGDVVPIERCLLATEKINQGITKLIPAAIEMKNFIASIQLEEHREELFFTFKPRQDISQTSVEVQEYCSKINREFRTCAGNVPFGHFGQINDTGNKILVELVCNYVTSDAVTELYAGAGNFSLPLARKGRNVEAVEVDKTLVRYGKELVEREHFTQRVRFFEMSCEKFLRNHKLRKSVVLDPPRSGAINVVESLDPNVTSQIVYVSCNLPSLCRDLKALAARGYECIKVNVLDMFSQTHHVEMVCLLGI